MKSLEVDMNTLTGALLVSNQIMGTDQFGARNASKSVKALPVSTRLSCL